MCDAARIRPARPADLRDIASIELDAARLFPEADLPAHLRYRSTETHELAAACKEGRIWVASQGRRSIGYAMTGLVDGSPYLVELDVRPEFGRRGIGTALLERAIVWAARTGAEFMTLVTFAHLPWNAPFYERHGFVRLGATDIGAELRELMIEEERLGLRNRIAMRRVLAAPPLAAGSWN